MELNDFLMHVAMRKPLDTPEIMELLNRMSDEARRITFELNGSYHTMEEIRALMSRLFGRPVDDTFRVFPPFYIIRKSKFPQNPKRSVRFSGKRTKRSVQKRKARNTQKAETKVL